MAGESRKWVVLIATIWIQAFTGTNFDFSSYSSELKSVLDITQLQLNYLSVASDMGKAFGWCCGVSLMYFPLWVVLFMAAFMGILGYGLQWLVIQRLITLPYFLVFFLCLIAGCSICWFNTICYILCIKNFTSNRSLALSLSISFNGVSAALYTLIANAIISNNDTLYLFLNAIVPLLISALVLIPILQQPQPQQQHSADTLHRSDHDSLIFLCLNILALVTGLYLLCLYSLSSSPTVARVILVGAIFLLSMLLFLPSIVYSKQWSCFTLPTSFSLYESSFAVIENNDDNHELDKELISIEDHDARDNVSDQSMTIEKSLCFVSVLEKEKIIMLGEEHTTKMLIRRWDFWLYFIAYFCGGTIGLVYSNNLGQISQSLGHNSLTSSLVTLYSTCSFFGRLLAAAPDLLSSKIHFARTGWFAAALIPTPIAFILLAISGTKTALQLGTSLIGLSSGFVFSAAVSITSELFGPNSVGLKTINMASRDVVVYGKEMLYADIYMVELHFNCWISFKLLAFLKD
ncbi:hypothetical protein L195_g005238 [Trifolium pratense]|uniref:Uncharacterized protein n=1 Tax=Trifolium pratense TaxID=57577 RepID=A0A2K3P081_TRIPR|nr:hypothetical protein L195_g005238 [Trifolium pratense]